MQLTKINVSKDAWTLIGDGVSNITFQNASQQPVYVTTTPTNTTPALNSFGVVFELYQGYRGPIPDSSNKYVWAKAVSKSGSILVGTGIDDLFHGAIGAIPWEANERGTGGYLDPATWNASSFDARGYASVIVTVTTTPTNTYTPQWSPNNSDWYNMSGIDLAFNTVSTIPNGFTGALTFQGGGYVRLNGGSGGLFQISASS